MKTVVLVKWWESGHPARYGAPAGVDQMAVEVARFEFMGRTYQTETVTCNGVVTYSGQYPADTEYARGRVEKYQG